MSRSTRSTPQNSLKLRAAVVSTNRGYVREYFGDEAHYADPADLGSIRDAVVRALERGHSMALRQRILDNFTLEHAARATLDAYRRVLGRPSGSPG